MNRDLIILQWHELQNQLAVLKQKEMELRALVIQSNFSDLPPLAEGVSTIELGNGYKLKCTSSVDYKFENLEKAKKAYNKLVELDENTAIRLIKWKPELSLTEFRKLAAPLKKVIDSVIVCKEKAPSLKLIAPSGDADE